MKPAASPIRSWTIRPRGARLRDPAAVINLCADVRQQSTEVGLPRLSEVSPMNWLPLATSQDLEALLTRFGGFHDACLREIHVWTETYVGPDLGMTCPSHLDTRARVLIQRQFRDPAAIELLFEEVVGLHVIPTGEHHDSIIFSASLIRRGPVTYWADVADWEPDAENRDGATWIGAHRVSWRDASSWLGPDLRYGTPESAPTRAADA